MRSGQSPHYRELTVDEYRELHALCRKYAEKWFVRHFMPMCDLDDTVVESVDAAYERVCRKPDVKNLSGFMKVSAFRSVASELRKRKYRKNLEWIDAIPLTMPDTDETNRDDEAVEEGFLVSDGGLGVHRLVEGVSWDLDRGIVPRWKRLYRIALAKQKGKAASVIRALRKDSRPVVARELSGIPERTFFRILKKIQSDFAQCYRAYREFRAEIEWQ